MRSWLGMCGTLASFDKRCDEQGIQLSSGLLSTGPALIGFEDSSLRKVANISSMIIFEVERIEKW